MPALTITSRVTVKDSSAAQTGTIMREDTAENSGVSSHYVIDVQGQNGMASFSKAAMSRTTAVPAVQREHPWFGWAMTAFLHGRR